MKFWDWLCSCFKEKKSTEDNRAESRDSSIDSQDNVNIRSAIAKGLIPQKETGTLFGNFSNVNVTVTVTCDDGVRKSGDIFHHRDSE